MPAVEPTDAVPCKQRRVNLEYVRIGVAVRLNNSELAVVSYDEIPANVVESIYLPANLPDLCLYAVLPQHCATYDRRTRIRMSVVPGHTLVRGWFDCRR